MGMTKEDFKGIARTIRNADKIVSYGTSRDGPYSDLTDKLADWFERRYPFEFNRKLFLKSCFNQH